MQFERTSLSGWHFDILDAETQKGFEVGFKHAGSGGFPEVQKVDDSLFILDFSGIGKFAVRFDRNEVVAFDVEIDATEQTLSHLLLDHVVPRIIAHGDNLVLHASAVELGGEVAIFLGDSGAGKSTLGASLHAAGFTLLGDDAVVIVQSHATFRAQTVYSSLRLYPDAVGAVIGQSAKTSEMAHYSSKLRVELASREAEETSLLPVGTIFFLAKEASIEARSVPLTPMQSCMKLIEQSFALNPRDGILAASRMARASAMASSLPSFKLFYPRDFSRIPDVHRVIFDCVTATRPSTTT